MNREHEDIYGAISRGDADGARAAMRNHIGNGRERLKLRQGLSDNRSPEEPDEAPHSRRARARRTARRSPIAGAQTKLKWAHVYETSEPYHK